MRQGRKKAQTAHRYIKHKFDRAIPKLLLYLWWLLLSGNYLFKFWSNPMVAGADGSGHVAVLHLYAKHIYPDLHGWIPELFGGMPFPVYYPPLFYWFGATLMLFGINATVAAKLLTITSFAALPAVLYLLARKVGLNSIEASIAAGAAGVVACGSNIVSLSGIGLLGLFEVGLFTQTLGFVLFCLWAAYLPRAGRSLKASVCAIFFLVATILSNAHILPLVAFYALTWFLTSFGWNIRMGSTASYGMLRKTAFTLVPLLGPLLICGIWLIPLLTWYRYSVGQPLSSVGLFTSLGSLNIVWPLCGYVGWRERKRRPHLSSLCVTVLIIAIVALSPLADFLKHIPFQPPRVLAGALLLCTIPVTKMAARILTESLGGKRVASYAILTFCILALGWLHPIQRFGIGSLPERDAKQIEEVRNAVRVLPAGKLLVEIVEPTAIFNSPENRTRELALSRALTHEIAGDGRPVLWSVFREQSIMAPYATAVSNLFSTTKETFGLDGLALQRSGDESVSLENRLLIATKLGVAYFLVKTSKSFDALKKASGVRLLWSINGWSLFADQGAAADIQKVPTLPVFVWMKVNSKKRNVEDIEFFNLGEQLAFEGFPDVLPLCAQSEGVDVWDSISKLQDAVVVINPADVPSNQEEWCRVLFKEAGKLRMILLDDDSNLAAKINERQQDFASYTQIKTNQTVSNREILKKLVWAISVQAATPSPTNEGLLLWRTSAAYFPTWQTSDNQSTFLTGQGGAAILSADVPSLRWHSGQVRLLSISVCTLGFLISCVYLRVLKLF